jgi:hypothetical protein
MEYLVSQHLPLERTRSYPDLLGCNRWPVVPGVQDPDTINHQFHSISNLFSGQC